MVPAVPTAGYPAGWPTDGRDGGAPDPTTGGPSFYQIGSEGGFLPQVAVIHPQPVNYDYARRSVTITNVLDKALYMGPAERADVIIDFSQYAGKTIIMYNDAPAPMPGFDPRYDYYTGDVDQTAAGGAPTTLPGYGPNTRTIMQFVVAPGTNPPFNRAALENATTGLPNAYVAYPATAHRAGNLLSAALSGIYRHHRGYVWLCPIAKLDLYSPRSKHTTSYAAGDEGHN